jgi:hypothetical protein
VGKQDVDAEAEEVDSPDKEEDAAIVQLQSGEEEVVGPNEIINTDQPRVCDWAQAIICDNPEMIAYRCHTEGCTKMIHHHCQSGWEQREGYDANISLLCCEHHPDYKAQPPLLNADENNDLIELFAVNNGIPDGLERAWKEQNVCGVIEPQNPSESPKKKSTNDTELTEWQATTYELADSVIDVRYLHKMRIRASVPVQWCVDTANIMSAKSFIAAFLVKISKSTWELMDDKGELLQQLDWDGDEGITNLFGTYLQQPNEAFCEYYETQLSEKKAETFFVSPKRDALRKRAGENMEKAASSMKKKAIEKYGNEKVCEVGEVVHVRLKNEDKAKVDSGNLTGVIVKVNKDRSQARVAVNCGLLKSWYAYHMLGRISGKSNDVALNGLTDALNGWESMKVISEREAARKASLVGGQGKGDVTCKCKGSCNTNSCSCFKAGRICCSACHRNNFKCCNNDRNESIKK